MARKVEALERVVHALNDSETLDTSGMGTAELINEIAKALPDIMSVFATAGAMLNNHEQRIKALEGKG